MCSKVRLLLLLLLLGLLLLGSRVGVAGRKLCATAAAGLPSGVDEALQQGRSSVCSVWRCCLKGTCCLTRGKSGGAPGFPACTRAATPTCRCRSSRADCYWQTPNKTATQGVQKPACLVQGHLGGVLMCLCRTARAGTALLRSTSRLQSCCRSVPGSAAADNAFSVLQHSGRLRLFLLMWTWSRGLSSTSHAQAQVRGASSASCPGPACKL